MVLGACGHCGLAHVWINVFPSDRDDMTVKPLLRAHRIRLDCGSDTRVLSQPRRATRFWFGDEQGVFFTQEPFILLLLRFWGLRVVSSARLHTSRHEVLKQSSGVQLQDMSVRESDLYLYILSVG